MQKRTFAKRHVRFPMCLIICLSTIALLVTNGCPPPPPGDTYTSAASVGDLLSYSINTVAKTYSYEIVDSDFGLEGTKRSGLLIDNGDFTYSPLDDPTTALVPFEGTLLVGHLSLPLHEGVFFAGVPATEVPYTPEDVAGTYNWIGLSCDLALVGGDCPTQYLSHYGTMRIDLGGAAEVCRQGNVDDQGSHPCQLLDAVSWEDKGNGLIEMTMADVPYATLMIHLAGSGEKVMAIDMKNRPAGAYAGSDRGPGMAVGINKYASAGTELDGMYFGVENLMDAAGTGYYMKSLIRPDDSFEINLFFLSNTHGRPAAVYEGTVVRDEPWEGWITADDSNPYAVDRFVLILPESGVYFAVNPTNDPFFFAGARSTCTDADGDEYYVEAGCLRAGDCNDSDPDINPGAEEICNDGTDQNCDKYECTGLFTDRNLEMKVREALDKPEGEITPSDLLELTVLSVWLSDVTYLTGLEYCVNLTTLNLSYNFNIFDLSPLTNLVNLDYLSLEENNVVDISPLAGLVNLTRLHLGRNPLADISPLAGLVNLTELGLGSNRVVDVSPLAGMVNLASLVMSNNDIADIGPLAGLPNLTSVALFNNEITDIYPLVQNPGVNSGDTVNVSGNPLSATSCNVYIPELLSRGVTVDDDCP